MPRVNYNAIRKKLKEVSLIDTKQIYVNKREATVCDACSPDPFTGVDSFCSKCGGTGKTISDARIPINASVDYITGTENSIGSNYTFQRGDIILTIHVNQLTGAGINPEDFLNQPYPVEYFIINNKRYKVISTTPGELNGVMFEVELLVRLPETPQSNL